MAMSDAVGVATAAAIRSMRLMHTERNMTLHKRNDTHVRTTD